MMNYYLRKGIVRVFILKDFLSRFRCFKIEMYGEAARHGRFSLKDQLLIGLDEKVLKSVERHPNKTNNQWTAVTGIWMKQMNTRPT